jgi:DNA-binding transcriptional LysR family regulator
MTKKRLELRHLRALLALINEGGYVRAARAIGISQSTLSETIRSLERLVGGALVEKTRALQLTTVGEALLPYARKMVALESEAMAELSRKTHRLATSVVVCCSESISAYLLPPVLHAIRRRWPNCQLRVQTATCIEIRAGLKRGRFHLGLVCEPLSRGTPQGSEVLAESELALFCASESSLAGSEPRIGELRRRPFHLSDAAGSFAGLVRQYFQAAGCDHPELIATGSVEGVKRAVASDPEALGLLPLFAVEEELRRGSLARVLPRPALPSVVLKALSAPGQAPPLIEELVQVLRDSLASPESARAKRAQRP